MDIPWEWQWLEMEETYANDEKEVELALGDYDGDGKTDRTIVIHQTGENSQWYILGSKHGKKGVPGIPWGWEWPDMSRANELILGDYDKDGMTDRAMIDKSTGQWYIWSTRTLTQGVVGDDTQGIPEIPWGWEWPEMKEAYNNENKVVELALGDYDGDGIMDRAMVVHNKSTGKSIWYIWNSSIKTQWSWEWSKMSSVHDLALGDYDGDGITDPTICNMAEGKCSLWSSVARNDTTFIPLDWEWPWPGMTSAHTLAVGDYDGDGVTNGAIVHKPTGHWYVIDLTPFKDITFTGTLSATGERTKTETFLANYDSTLIWSLSWWSGTESSLTSPSKQALAATAAESELELIITSPSGQTFTPTSEEVINYHKGDGEEYYVLNTDEQGKWSFDVVGVNVGPAGVSYELTITDNSVSDFASEHIVVATTSNQIFIYSPQGEAEQDFAAIGNQVTTTDSDNDDLDEIAVTDGTTIAVYEFDGNSSSPNTLPDQSIFQVTANVDVDWANEVIVGLKDENTIVIDGVSVPVFAEFANQSQTRRATRKGKKGKITICHKGQTKSLPEPAVAAHLGHGDTLGDCASTPDKKDKDKGKDSDKPANEDDDKGNDKPANDDKGNNDKKVTICHIPPGNPSAAHNITISVNALPAHLGHGDTEGACPSVPPPPPPPPPPEIIYGVNVAAGDLNNDGKAEIVAAMASQGSYIEIYTGDGQRLSVFSAQFASNNGVIVTTGDVNNDGTVDIIAGDAGGTEVRIFDLNGNSIGNVFSVATGNITSLAFGKGTLTEPSAILAREVFKTPTAPNLAESTLVNGNVVDKPETTTELPVILDKPATTTELPIIPPPPLTGAIGYSHNYGGQTLFDAVIESGTSVAKVELEGAISNQGLVSNATLLPDATFTGGKMTGYIVNNGTIADIEFVGAELIGGYLSGVIIVSSEPTLGLGILRDVTVLPETTVVGGVLAGDIDNQGTLVDIIIKATAIITGGILEGVIQNNGLLQDVTLAKDTLIQGGSVAGTVIGNIDNPALIIDAEVLEDTVLENVIIGAGTHLADEVNIGEGVHFESDNVNQ